MSAFSFCPSHFLSQRLSHNLPAAEGETFPAQVLQRGTDVIHRVVDAEEAVVGVWECINGDRAMLISCATDILKHEALCSYCRKECEKFL
ncbi:MAG: hypothetical protein IJM12_02395 [Bacteroidales bacterium]|nr:hypothetical protein [Bacteroidales bacterium]